MNPGDIVMVTEQKTNEKTNEKYQWRWFGVVIEEYRRRRRQLPGPNPIVYRLGKYEGRVTLWWFRMERGALGYEVLSEERVPEGVHALRMAAVLDGKIDI